MLPALVICWDGSGALLYLKKKQSGLQPNRNLLLTGKECLWYDHSEEMNEMNPNMGRSSIFAVVGGYLIYMAYEILRDMINDVPTTMSRFLRILVIVLFTGIGITLLFFAWRFWKKGREDQDKNPVDLEEQEAKAKNEEAPPEK